MSVCGTTFIEVELSVLCSKNPVSRYLYAIVWVSEATMCKKGCKSSVWDHRSSPRRQCQLAKLATHA